MKQLNLEDLGNNKFLVKIPEGCNLVRGEKDWILIQKELPSTWIECIKAHKGSKEFIDIFSEVRDLNDKSKVFDEEKDLNIVPAGYGKKLLALSQLLICRDVYRDGWLPSNNKPSWCIGRDNTHRLFNVRADAHKCLCSFPTKNTAERFLNNFESLLVEAGDLFY